MNLNSLKSRDVLFHVLIDNRPSVVKVGPRNKNEEKKCPAIFGHWPGTIALRNLNRARTIIKVYVMARAQCLGVLLLSSTLCYCRKKGKMPTVFSYFQFFLWKDEKTKHNIQCEEVKA